jgi:hypothetical protein
LSGRHKSAPTFYVDESIFSNVLVAELTAAEISFDRVDVAFSFGTSDEEWLSRHGALPRPLLVIALFAVPV